MTDPRMPEPCARWVALQNELAVGRKLAAPDAAYVREHAAACLSCAREAAALRVVDARGSVEPLEGRAREALVDTLVRHARVVEEAHGERRGWRFFGVAAALGAIAAVVFVVGFRHRTESDLGGDIGATAQLLSPVAGEGTDRSLYREGDIVRVAATPSCLGLRDGIRVCFAPRSEVRLVSLRRQAKRLLLERGTAVASLAPQPRGTTFSIETAAGSATAVGTVFAVEVSRAAHIVRVLEGSVVTNAASVRKIVAAGHAVVLGQPDVRGITTEERDADLALAMGHAGAPVDLRVPAPAPFVPVAPPPAVSRASAHPRGGNRAPAARLGAASEASREASAEALDEALLEEAQTLRAARRFAEAARKYEEIVRRRPGSAGARVASVSLGTLALSSLNDPERALRAFDVYLRTGERAFAQEALYGRARALRALGRAPAERAAIEAALVAFPNGVYAEPLRERLRELAIPEGK